MGSSDRGDQPKPPGKPDEDMKGSRSCHCPRQRISSLVWRPPDRPSTADPGHAISGHSWWEGNGSRWTVLSDRRMETQKPAPMGAGLWSGVLVGPRGDPRRSGRLLGQGAQASGADTHLTCGLSIDYRLVVQVHLPAPLGPVVRVADAVTERGAPAANIAHSCHVDNPQFIADYKKHTI